MLLQTYIYSNPHLPQCKGKGTVNPIFDTSRSWFLGIQPTGESYKLSSRWPLLSMRLAVTLQPGSKTGLPAYRFTV